MISDSMKGKLITIGQKTDKYLIEGELRFKPNLTNRIKLIFALIFQKEITLIHKGVRGYGEIVFN